MVVGNKKRTL